MKIRSFVATFALFAAFATVPSQALAGSDDIVIEGAWSRASIGTGRPSAAYMTIRNSGETAVSLTGIKTPLAKKAEIHRTKTSSTGVSSMEPVGDIVVSPSKAVALEPGGMHVMLMRLQKPLVKGETFPLTLIFSDGGEAKVEIPVLALSARGPAN